MSGKARWIASINFRLHLIDCTADGTATVLPKIFNDRDKAVSLNISDTPLERRERLRHITQIVIPSCRLLSKVACVTYLYGALPNIQAIKILRRFLSVVIDVDEPARNHRSLFNVCELFICPSFIRRDDTRMGVDENHFPDCRWQPSSSQQTSTLRAPIKSFRRLSKMTELYYLIT